MYFPPKIQLALEQYSHHNEFTKHRFDDHPAVQDILNIPDIDKQDPAKLYQCFNKNNEPALSQASFQVYLAILNYFLESLGLISDKKVTVYPKNLEYLDPAFLSVKQETGSENNLWVGLLHWDTFNKQTLMIEERHELLKIAVKSLENRQMVNNIYW